MGQVGAWVCSELEFVQIARLELELGKIYCDRYSQ
jgi:hypothetical protein